MPFALPDWLPWWVPVLIAIPALFYLAVFLLMPFSVFGVKARLEVIDARLDEIQGEIRALSLRLPEEPGEPLEPPRGERVRMREERPPIPPAPPDRALAPAAQPPRRAEPVRPVSDLDMPPRPREDATARRRPRDEEWDVEDRREPPPRRPRGPNERAEPRLDWPR